MKSIPKEDRKCTNCGAVDSPLWRRLGAEGKVVCNACGLYFRNHGTMRDISTLFGASSGSASKSSAKESKRASSSQSQSSRSTTAGSRSEGSHSAKQRQLFGAANRSTHTAASKRTAEVDAHPPEYRRLLEVADLATLYACQLQKKPARPSLYHSPSVQTLGAEVRSGTVVEYVADGCRHAIIERIFRDESGTAYFLPIQIVHRAPNSHDAAADTENNTLDINKFVLCTPPSLISAEARGFSHTVPLQPVAAISKVFRLVKDASATKNSCLLHLPPIKTNIGVTKEALPLCANAS